MVFLASRSGALTVLLQWTCWHANAQRARSGPVASQFAAPVSLGVAARGSWASSFEVEAGDEIAAERTRGVVVRYDAAVIDSHAKTAEKARELEVMPGVQNASALTCVGVVVVSCHSEQVQRQLLDDLTGDPHVEFAQHTDSGMGHCNMPEIQSPTSLQMVSARIATDNLTQLSTDPAKFVGGYFTVSGLDLEVARGMRQAWQHLLALGLSNMSEADIEITHIAPFPTSHQGRGAVPAAAHSVQPSKHHIREKPRALRSRSVKVEYRVFAAAGSDPAFLDAVEAQVGLLHRSGRATERFDAALDSELAGREVVLPDWSRSRFSRSYRGPRVGNPSGASEDDSMLVLVAFMMMIFCVAPAFGISTVLCLFSSPIGEWDGYY